MIPIRGLRAPVSVVAAEPTPYRRSYPKQRAYLSPHVRWTPELDTRLRQLRESGLSMSDIGEEMGLSKNAVVGRAQRINLKRRENPVKRGSHDK